MSHLHDSTRLGGTLDRSGQLSGGYGPATFHRMLISGGRRSHLDAADLSSKTCQSSQTHEFADLENILFEGF